MEEALIEMYLAGVSVRRVEDIIEALWGSKVSPAEQESLRPHRGLAQSAPCGRVVPLDDIYLRRNWGGKFENVAKMLKAIHAQESKKYAREKAKAVVAELRAMKLKQTAQKMEDGIEETLTYYAFPSEHWTRIRTNNIIEWLN